MQFISVIPARKSSKGIKNKNVLKLNKKPLIEYTYKEVQKSILKKNFVLTDSNKIKRLSKRYKINSNYNRPKKLSGDKISLTTTLNHFYKWTKKNSINFDYIVVLQPTSPLRLSIDINKAIQIVKKYKPKSLFSISSSLEHPYETIKINKNSFNHILQKSKNFFRRQDFDINSFFINGSIYVISKQLIKEKKIYSKKNHKFYIMPKSRSLEINDLEEAKIIESMLKYKK